MSGVHGSARPGLSTGWAAAFWCCASGAAALTLHARQTDLIAGEPETLRWTAEHLSWLAAGPLHVLDTAFTGLAAPAVFAVLTLLVWRAWGRWPTLIFGIAGASTGITKIADLASRPRPSEAIEWGPAVFGSGGYPSGHVVYTVVVFGMLAHLARQHGRSRAVRIAVPAISIGIIVLTGPSRLAELDHWPADVVGGYLIGLSWLAASIWLEHRGESLIVQSSPRLGTRLGVPMPSTAIGRTTEMS